MLRTVSSVVAVCLLLATAASAAPPHKKRHVTRHWHGYGFLPGYRPPEVIERERARHAWQRGPVYYGPAWPGFYRGTLERRRFRSVLHANAYRADVELRPIIGGAFPSPPFSSARRFVLCAQKIAGLRARPAPFNA